MSGFLKVRSPVKKKSGDRPKKVRSSDFFLAGRCSRKMPIDLLNDKKVTETSDNIPSDLTTLTKGLGEVIRQISVGDLLTPKVH